MMGILPWCCVFAAITAQAFLLAQHSAQQILYSVEESGANVSLGVMHILL